ASGGGQEPPSARRSPHPLVDSNSLTHTVSPRFRQPSWLLVVLAACVAGSIAGSAGHAFRAAEAVGDCTTGSDWGTPKQDLAPAVRTLVTPHRSSRGLWHLRISPPLTNAALWKARHMAKYGYFGHDDPA